MIKIIDDWYITVDAYPINYVVRRGEGKKDKNGKLIDKSRGYFTTLRGAVKEIRRQYVSDQLSKGVRTLEGALSTISSIDARFEKLMENITE